MTLPLLPRIVNHKLDILYNYLTESMKDDRYLPLVDYSMDESSFHLEDNDRDTSKVLDQTLDTLKSHLAAMNTSINENMCCRLRRRVQLGEQKKIQERRVSLRLETEIRQEEERKVKVIQDVTKVTKRRSKKLSCVQLHSEIFRRFSPRRTTLRGPAKRRPLKSLPRPLKLGKMTPRRQSAIDYLLFSERLCFKPAE